MVTTWILPLCEIFQLNKVRSTLLYHSLIRVLINASSFISTPQVEIMHMRLNYWTWHLFLNQSLSNMFAESLGNKQALGKFNYGQNLPFRLSFIFHNFRLKRKMSQSLQCVYFIIWNNGLVQNSIGPAAQNADTLHFLLKHFQRRKTEKH